MAIKLAGCGDIKNPGATDCNGIVLDMTTANLATCSNLTSAINTALTASGAKDCVGNAIDFKTAKLATCADLAAAEKNILDCNGVSIPDGTRVATCTDVTAKIDAALVAPGAKNCAGVSINLKTDTLATCADVSNAVNAGLAAPGAKNCAGVAINLKTDTLATCADITALQAALAALTARVATLEAAMANKDTITDCNGVVIATYVKG